MDWYGVAQRALPFRSTGDAYAVWVSEIMAQQTRITALIPYFESFIRAFPTVAALAAASEHDVLKAWEGLGYYSRARNLHKAAQLILEHHGGAVPSDPAALRALPGIGDYTAGAILSIAFSQRQPAVDGNVLRVHARLENDSTDVMCPAAKDKARAWVLSLMPQDVPGDMTQALMELGALICLPKTPRCGECPVASLCAARLSGCEQQLPVKTPKKPQRAEQREVYLLFDPQGRVLMRRRCEALLRGLWEFPHALPDGIQVLSKTPCGSAVHVFTHIIWQMEGFDCRVLPIPAPEGAVWADAALFDTLPIPVAFKAFTELVKTRFSQKTS